MRITQKISNKNNDLLGQKPVTIAFIGDSVTQGCFECYFDNDGKVQTVFDYANSYPVKVRETLNLLYPSAQINIINSGISGDSAPSGASRFDRDVAPYNPDLVVVSFGLNDACAGKDYVENYTSALKTIFEKTKNLGAECIFIFQNMMFADANTFIRYNNNMRQLTVDKLRDAEMLVLNRATEQIDKEEIHKIVRGISRRTAIVYDYPDGHVEYDEIEDEYVIEGPRIEKMLGYTNLESEKGFTFFQNFLKDSGILEQLEELGIEEGDTVRMYGLSFDYYK